MSPHSAREQRDAVYLTWSTALCGPLQTIILAFLRFLVIAGMEDSGSTLDFSCLPMVHYKIFFCAILFVSFLVAFATKVCSEGLKCVQRS